MCISSEAEWSSSVCNSTWLLPVISTINCLLSKRQIRENPAVIYWLCWAQFVKPLRSSLKSTRWRNLWGNRQLRWSCNIIICRLVWLGESAVSFSLDEFHVAFKALHCRLWRNTLHWCIPMFTCVYDSGCMLELWTFGEVNVFTVLVWCVFAPLVCMRCVLESLAVLWVLMVHSYWQ